MFVISITDNETKKQKFWSHDRDCGHLMQGTRLSSAIVFSSLEDAEKEWNAIMKELDCTHTFSNGIVTPSDVIHRGLDMSHFKVKASGVLAIQRILLHDVKTLEVSGEIKKPTGFTYG